LKLTYSAGIANGSSVGRLRFALWKDKSRRKFRKRGRSQFRKAGQNEFKNAFTTADGIRKHIRVLTAIQWPLSGACQLAFKLTGRLCQPQRFGQKRDSASTSWLTGTSFESRSSTQTVDRNRARRSNGAARWPTPAPR
jgi:hypothetical protein